MTYWVCKPDGSIQCADIMGVPLEVMRKQLELLIGAENVLDARQTSVPVITLCGMPTGVTNAYEITDEGHWILFHGFVGPMGFKDCDADSRNEAKAADVAESNLGELLVQSAVTSAQANPVLIRELIGRPVRVYEKGSIITMDYVPERVNVVTLNRRISDIWFG